MMDGRRERRNQDASKKEKTKNDNKRYEEPCWNGTKRGQNSLQDSFFLRKTLHQREVDAVTPAAQTGSSAAV